MKRKLQRKAYEGRVREREDDRMTAAAQDRSMYGSALVSWRLSVTLHSYGD